MNEHLIGGGGNIGRNLNILSGFCVRRLPGGEELQHGLKKLGTKVLLMLPQHSLVTEEGLLSFVVDGE